MDWSRAKTVLILAFLVLNILLGYQLWMDELNLNNFTTNAAKRDEMNRMLELKNIRLQASVPEAMPILSEITVSLRNGEEAMEWKTLSQSISESSLADTAYVENTLKTDIPMMGEYELDRKGSGEESAAWVMNQLHNGLPMFPIRLELAGEGNRITKYRVLYAEVEPSHDAEAANAQQVLSAYTILGNLAEYYLPQGSEVSDVRLGYHGPLFESETQVLAPYWRVVLSTGETYYVHAVTGAVEGPSS